LLFLGVACFGAIIIVWNAKHRLHLDGVLSGTILLCAVGNPQGWIAAIFSF
jgi:hypothetical protein